PRGFVKDENGKIQMKTVTPSEVFKGLGGFSVTADVDIQGEATKIGEKLGKSITSDVDGYQITSEQSWESKIEGTREIVRGMLGSPSSLTPLAKRLWADEMGEKSRKLSEADMVKLEEKMLEKIKPLYDIEVKKTINYGARESARGRAQKKTEGNVSPEYVTDTKLGGAKIVQVNGVDANVISFGDGKGIETIGTEATKESIQNIYVDKNGNIFADKLVESKEIGEPILNDDGSTNLVATAMNKAKGWTTKKEPKT
ncbi:unnamed protein product, partial [marine sediment metagenome]